MIGGTLEKVSDQHSLYRIFVLRIDTTYQEEGHDLELLNCREIRLEFEFRQDNDLIASEWSGMANNDQRIDVTLGQKTQHDFRVPWAASWTQGVPPCFLQGCNLQGIRDDVAVRDHDSFLKANKGQRSWVVRFSSITYRQTRRSTGVTQESGSTSTFTCAPIQPFQFGERFPDLY